MSHSHKPSALKQQNKKFKTRHASKGDLKRQAKGRIPRVSPKVAAKSSLLASQTRLNRQNTAKQVQAKKRHDLLTATKLFGGVDGAPRIVAVIPLCPDVSGAEAVKHIAEGYDGDVDGIPSGGLWKTRAERFKTNLQFVILPYRQLYMALDACKAADYVVFVLSPTTEVDAWGELAMRCLQAQGLPEVVSVAMFKEPTSVKSSTPIMKSLLSFMQYFVPSLSKVHDVSTRSSALNAARSICEGRPAPVRWREDRAWLLAESVQWEASESESQSGSLRVTGVIRGAPLSANRLVHLPEYGDFQLEKIVSAPLPKPRKPSAAPEMEVEPSTLHEPTPDDAESLTSRLEADTMANEQTWPTEEEMNHDGASTSHNGLPDAKVGTTPKRVKRVPRGTSAYQAAWIVESDEEEEDDGDEIGSDDVSMTGADDAKEGSEADGRSEVEEDLVDLVDDMESKKSKQEHEDLDMDEENDQHAQWLASRAEEKARAKEDADDLGFPDEVDTPRDIPARERFGRYRGLRSFRTSPWDPFENLPVDYARIFRFENYERIKRNVRRRIAEEGVQPGTRVTVFVKNVPKACADSYNPLAPFMLFGLWEYEHKMTSLHFAVQRNTEYDAPVRSKEPLILCVGPRRYSTNPIYSQHVRGGGKGTNNVHKFEKFLRPGTTSIATVYGPSCFGKLPCMLLKENPEDGQAPSLVASGTFLNPDTQRIIAKRIILTGHPYKVHKRVATIRFMFFNPTDINYFKPIELHTKYGRTGHIKESLGTHGYFKAHFDKPLSQVDTVCLALYKRVYPRWSTPYVAPRATIEEAQEKDAVMS